MKLNDLNVVLLTHGVEQVKMKPFDSPAMLKMNVLYKYEECFMYAGMTSYVLELWVRYKPDLNRSESIYQWSFVSGEEYKNHLSPLSIPGLESDGVAAFIEDLIDNLKDLHVELYPNVPRRP